MTRRELEVTDPAVIRHILDESKVLHLGLVDDGMPYIVPMNYGCKWEADKLTLYLHSASSGYKLDVIAKNPVCCFEMECGLEPFEDIKDFSGGQKKKVLIAKSLCEKAHLYVWDEPLNFIDVYSRMQIEQLITEFAPTMLLVEHDSVFRDTVASKIVNI